jgi:cobalt-zinc-cadmium efflux system membrane fusion protein
MAGLAWWRSGGMVGLLGLGLAALIWSPDRGPSDEPSVAAVTVWNGRRLAGDVADVAVPVDGQIVTASWTDAQRAGHAWRPGDRVRRGQLLAVVWSPELSERKSRLLAAASRHLAGQQALAELQRQRAEPIAIAEAESHCRIEAAILARAEADLRKLGFTAEEMLAIRTCAARLHAEHDAHLRPADWAQFELHAPCDGVLVQAVTAGSSVHHGNVLFRIAEQANPRGGR